MQQGSKENLDGLPKPSAHLGAWLLLTESEAMKRRWPLVTLPAMQLEPADGQSVVFFASAVWVAS